MAGPCTLSPLLSRRHVWGQRHSLSTWAPWSLGTLECSPRLNWVSHSCTTALAPCWMCSMSEKLDVSPEFYPGKGDTSSFCNPQTPSGSSVYKLQLPFSAPRNFPLDRGNTPCINLIPSLTYGLCSPVLRFLGFWYSKPSISTKNTNKTNKTFHLSSSSYKSALTFNPTINWEKKKIRPFFQCLCSVC